jgi:hypothetical protein
LIDPVIVTGAVVPFIGAAMVLIDMFDRWLSPTNVIDGDDASTDHAAELRKVKRREAPLRWWGLS